MARLTKKRKAILDKFTRGKNYAVNEAIDLVKEMASAKFAESIDVAVNLGVDPRKSDQVVRGASVLPKARTPRRRKRPARTWWASTISRSRSRAARWISTS